MENQGPLVKRASELFIDISGGKDKRLGSDDMDGRQVSLAEHSSGTQLTVDRLSAGRRDQIFLALRIATVERRLKARDRMLLLIDDLAIDFDGDTTTVTLADKAKSAKGPQVLMSTHPEHLLSLAKATLPVSDLVLRRVEDAQVFAAGERGRPGSRPPW